MGTAGIICEYNPFHKGHEYHIAETRRLLGGDCGIVCVMSGNYVQRGDTAVFEKHARAEAAVRCGADLVIELPLFWSMASAEKFAAGAVSLLAATGVVTQLSFGSECADTELLGSVADALLSGSADEQLREELKTGVSFAQARENAVKKVMGILEPVLKTPNDILAVEYLKALKRQKLSIEPLAIKRIGSGHDDETCGGGFMSASAVRKLLRSGKSIKNAVPDAAAEVFRAEIENGREVYISNIEKAVLYRLRTMREAEFAALPDDSEGLHNRMMKAARAAASISETIEMTKSKRYPAARIRRMIMNAFLGVTKYDGNGLPEYISVLAMNERGMALLSQMKETASLPVITKPASAKELSESAAEAYRKCAVADDIYALAFADEKQCEGGSAWKKSPVIVR